MENTLTYMDQGSFLALRALGRQPLIQFVWLYDRAVDIDGLRRFQRNLGHGLLGRRIETSPLPFGRHRWVADPGPADLEIAAAERSRDQVWEWADEHVRLPVDPEWGPAWRLGVQPLTDGGAAVSLVVSHSVADALCLVTAIADAASGNRRDLGYPAPGSRTRGRALAQDLRTTIRSLPDTGRALAATIRTARSSGEDLASSAKAAAPRRTPGGDQQVVAPTATVWIDLQQWDQRAESLGGSGNSLFAAVAARLAVAHGRVGDGNEALLSWPVSDRVAGDTRANALTAVMLPVDAAEVTTSLAGVRSGMKAALTALPETSKELLAPLGMVPVTPKFLLRRIEMMVGKIGDPTGCSNVGDLDPAVNRPDGTDAAWMAFRSLEPQITASMLDRTRGYLYAGSGRVHGQVFVSVGAWVAGGSNTKERLRESLAQAVADMGLTGTVE
ncbi:hypothetical protein [Mycolicibacterium mengxianglii]|uniref:hypothetical protein n=1 Tax=Mycolicibacterium mengxianglii TaxID=2736649 RepID=UPI001E44C5C2|nr:hypothetical protein [Mycolicibacterium mengxianglii]